jgi:methylaspartate ammonia-lyase
MLLHAQGLDTTSKQLIDRPQLHARNPFGMSQAVIDTAAATVATGIGNSIAGVHYHV